MANETGVQAYFLHSLISLEDFKTLLGLDDREDALSRYCLITATYTIEHYCLRDLLVRRHVERFEYAGDLLLPLREYPVREIVTMRNGTLIEPEFYRVIPDLEGESGEGPEDRVYSLRLSPALLRGRGLGAVTVVYRAGYGPVEVGDPYGVPADLGAACAELAAWKMSRYKGRRIGMTGKEQMEMSMPENVRFLLEPYRRKVI